MKERDRIDIRHGARGTRYRVRWTDDAGRHSRTFATEAEARTFLAELDLAQMRGTYQTPTDVTVDDVLQEYLRRSHARVQPSTYRSWSDLIRLHVPASVKRRRVVEMDHRAWQRWVDSLTDKGLAPGSVRLCVAVVTGAMNRAVKVGMIERNTLRGVEQPAPPPRAIRVWSMDEARRLLAQVEHDPMWHLIYLLGFNIGARPGEIRALQWRDYSPTRRSLHIRRTVSKDEKAGETVREGTKRGRGRHVALSTELVEAFERWREATDHDLYIFGGEKPLTKNKWEKYHVRVSEAAGVPRHTLHALRHSCATLLLEQGVNPLVVSRILGHARVEMTLNLYSHPGTDIQEEASSLLGRSLSNATTDARTTGENQGNGPGNGTSSGVVIDSAHDSGGNERG